MSTPNDHTSRPANPLRRVVAAVCLTLGGAAGASNLAAADAVTDWNAIATTTILNAQPTERPSAGIHWAMVQIAVYDAVNAIDGSYRVFAVRPASTPTQGASEPAAAVSAAYQVLLALFPSRATQLAASYAISLAAIADGDAKTRGIAIGAEVAAKLLLLRVNDGRFDVVPYVFGAGPGIYQLTTWQAPTPPPAPTGPVTPWLAKVKPFALKSVSQFRGDGPPELDSLDYADDFVEVKALGVKNSPARTVSQTEIGRFHTMNPTLFWGNNLNAFVVAQGLSLAENARLLAQLFVSYGDANIACWDAKYAFNRWRPETAIRNADADGNDATEADTAWLAQENTPPHPEYPAAHGCAAGAVMESLRQFFGTKHLDLSFTSTATGTTHVFHHTEAFLGEIGNARVYGGMHFRTSTEDGAALGRKVAKWVAKRHFTLAED